VKTFANILRLLFAVIWLFIGYVFAAVVMSLLIITIPFAIQSLKLAMFVIWPFGRTIVDRPGASVAASGCANVVWFIFGGWYMALIHVVTGLLLCIPIITIPFAVQNFKLAFLALAPFGKEIVSNEEAQRRRGMHAAAIGAATTSWPAAPPPPGTPYPTAPAVPPALLPPPGKDIGF
jgi:uncharacterized membrane protein YccF (DUF307 family)